MDVERKLLIETFEKNKKFFNRLLAEEPNLVCKFSFKAKESILDGDLLLQVSKHEALIHMETFARYCTAIAMAPNGSEELAQAHAKRSFILFHIGKYQDCLVDIDKALKITQTNALKIELLCRKVMCQKKLGIDTGEENLKKARFCCSKIDHMKVRKDLLKLIEETGTSVVDDVNEDTEAQDKEKIEIMKTLAKHDLSKVYNSIAINENLKYGRHLIAKKDFQPGEIIYVEKPSAVFLNHVKYYTNCNYCLKVCWSGIPCEKCDWVMFCNKKCKAAALHHDIECRTVSSLLDLGDDIVESHLTCLKVVITRIKEVGSISKLRVQLESIDKCSDAEEIFKNEKFSKSILNYIYVLKIDEFSKESLEKLASTVFYYLLSLIKYSSLFPNSRKYNKIEDLLQDDDVMFIGSLLMRLFKIKKYYASFMNFSKYYCEKLENIKDCDRTKCCFYGTCLSTVSNFLNHSCNPNVSRCVTNDFKYAVYAIRPIKKNEQLFISYSYQFYQKEKDFRQQVVKTKFHFSCNCEACVKNWPVLDKFQIKRKKMHQVEIQIVNESRSILKSVEQESNSFDKISILKLSRFITKAVKHLEQPSEIICMLVDALDKIMEKMYGLQPQLSLHQCVEARN